MWAFLLCYSGCSLCMYTIQILNLATCHRSWKTSIKGRLDFTTVVMENPLSCPADGLRGFRFVRS